MRSVKPVEDDADNNDEDEDDDSTREQPETENDSVPRDGLQPIPSRDLDVFPPCVGFEREEEIRDVGTFGVSTEDLEITSRNKVKVKPYRRKKKRKCSGQGLETLPSSVIIDGKRMDISPGPKAKTAAQTSPVWKFFGL